MTTNFKIARAIDVTKNTTFVQNLLRKGKATKNVETSVIEYILDDSDFNEGDRENLKYFRDELELQNNNWGLVKFNDAYERSAAYCIRLSNIDNKLTLEVGYEDEKNNLTKSVIPFEVSFKESKIKKGVRKAEYSVNGKPVRLVTAIAENQVDVQASSIVITLEELEVEIPLYRIEEVKTKDDVWRLWNSGEGHLIAQVPYTKTFYSNQIFKHMIGELLKNKQEFPSEGVAFLIGKPKEVEVTKKDGSGTFWKTDWEVYGCSKPEIQGINAYVDKDGKDVVQSFHFGEIKSLSFNRSSNLDTPYSTWINNGSLPMIGIVWFTGFNRNPNHIPKHKMYPMIGDDYDLSDRFIKSNADFLEEVDTLMEKLIEHNNKQIEQAIIGQIGAGGAEFAGMLPASTSQESEIRPHDLEDAELESALETFG